jgi:hypothetical protein
MAILGCLIINGHDYTPYVKQKTGITWERNNTNDKDAGRDDAETMHTLVTSHQRSLKVKLGPMPFSVAQQLEQDLEGGDYGVSVRYPDLYNGICTRRFYNTSISAAEEQFRDNEIIVDNVSFTLVSIREATV